MKLLTDWKDCWRWFSVQAMSLALTLQACWIALPADLRAMTPESVPQVVAIALLILGLIGRLVQQAERKETEQKKANDQEFHK